MNSQKIIAPMLSFVITFCLVLFYHFYGQESHFTFLGDSRHYLESCDQLVLLIRALFAGTSIDKYTWIILGLSNA